MDIEPIDNTPPPAQPPRTPNRPTVPEREVKEKDDDEFDVPAFIRRKLR